jgi:hypothetical protein
MITQRLTTDTVRLIHSSALARGILASAVTLMVIVALYGSAGLIALRPTAPAPIIIVATATPLRGAGASHDLHIFARMAAAPAVPAAATAVPITVMQAAPTAAPANGYVAQTDQGAVFVPDYATPAPTTGTYTGPFLAPATAQLPLDAPPLCTGFHDWRDYDPMYASSPICHQP